MTTWRNILIITICSMLSMAGCGGSETSSGSSGRDGICDLVDATVVAAAVGVNSVEEQDSALGGCRFDGPAHTGVATFDTVLQFDLIEGDGAARFGPTSDQLGLDVDGSDLAENDQGWFAYSAVIGDQRLTVGNGQDPQNVYYDSPELRDVAKQALETWVGQNSG